VGEGSEMTERMRRVNVFVTKLMCDNCEETEMVNSDLVYMTNPPRYKYMCEKCGLRKSSFKLYPIVTYEERCD
jgi:hypothetical protein